MQKELQELKSGSKARQDASLACIARPLEQPRAIYGITSMINGMAESPCSPSLTRPGPWHLYWPTFVYAVAIRE